MLTPLFRPMGPVLVPCLDRNPDGSLNAADGVALLDLEQAARHTSQPPAALRQAYMDFLGGLLPAEKPDAELDRILKDHVYPELSPDQFAHLMAVHKRLDLDPWLRLLWLETRHDVTTGLPRNFVLTTIDGLRTLAESSGLYRGQTRPYYLDATQQWRDGWVSEAPPIAIRIGVYRRGRKRPTWGTAYWREYAKYNDAGQLDPLYQRKPLIMLSTCAESVAIRKALGKRLSKIFTDVELANSVDPHPRGDRPRRQPIPMPVSDPAPAWEPRYLSANGLRLALLEEFNVKDLAQREAIVAGYINKWPTLYAHNEDKFFLDVLNDLWRHPPASATAQSA